MTIITHTQTCCGPIIKQNKTEIPSNLYTTDKRKIEFVQFIQNVMPDSLLIYLFCSSCEPEIVLTVLQIKSKAILCSRYLSIISRSPWTI